MPTSLYRLKQTQVIVLVKCQCEAEPAHISQKGYCYSEAAYFDMACMALTCCVQQQQKSLVALGHFVLQLACDKEFEACQPHKRMGGGCNATDPYTHHWNTECLHGMTSNFSDPWELTSKKTCA